MGSLRIRDLGKAFKRYPTRGARLAEWLGFGVRHELLWVLRDIGFEITPGESVGIIGVNGAGKSTLLKLIAGVMSPTTGTVEIQGRVAALLELGMGFQADFTGRQNVQMSGLLAGMNREDIQRKMREIEDFAEIGDYIDQPVRTYSSGMQVRLAFSVATAVRPDILIVDEALAVGDIFFQQKCFERIRGYLAAGTTLLFVSHAPATVYSLCQRAILLDAGRVALDAEPRQVIDLYNAMMAANSGRGQHRLAIRTGAAESGTGGEGTPIGSYGHARVRIEDVVLRCGDLPAHSVISGSELTAEVRVLFHDAFADPHVGFQIRDRRGEAVFMTHTHAMRQRPGAVRPGERLIVRFGFRVPLIAGDYSLTVGVADTGLWQGAVGDSLARLQDAWSFSIVADLDDIFWNGLCHLYPSVSIERATADPAAPPPAVSAAESRQDALRTPPWIGRPRPEAPPRLLATTSHALLEIDLDTGASLERHRGAGLYYGLAVAGDALLVGARGRLVSSSVPREDERGAILVLDADLRETARWQAPFPLRDLHEIAWYRDILWVTCSFDDSLALRHPDGRWEVWHPLGQPDGIPADRHHFNSLAFLDGRLHLLAHNHGTSERLAFDLHRRALLGRYPLGEQAHNLWRQDGQWVTCSSAEGRLLGDGGFSLSTGGFPRGVARVGESIVVGVSALAERGQRDLNDGELLVFDPAWRLQRRIHLPGAGLVLDLKPIAG